MRQAKREIKDLNEIISIMRECRVVRLALNDESGFPYIIPLNFGMDVNGDEITLIFHSAVEGTKIDLINKDNRASFEMDIEHDTQYSKEAGMCTMPYESVIGSGHIHFLQGSEKMEALKKLMDHYYPGQNLYFNLDTVPVTNVYAMKVEKITAKRREPKKF